MTGRTTDYVACGLRIRSSTALPLRTAPEPDDGRPAGADVTVRIGATPPRLPNPVADGRRRGNRAWEAAPGAFLMTVDDQARYLVADGRDVLIEPLGGSEREMGAFLIGPPFAALLQQRGLTTLQAGAVEAESGAVLFAGLKGAGKSTLLGALVERGYLRPAERRRHRRRGERRRPLRGVARLHLRALAGRLPGDLGAAPADARESA